MVSRMGSEGLCLLLLTLALIVGCGDGDSDAERCGSDAEGEELEENDCIGSSITGSVAEGVDDSDVFVFTVPRSGRWSFELSWMGDGDLDFYVDLRDGTPGQFEEVAAGASEFDNPERDTALLMEGEEVTIAINAFDTNFEEREYVFTFSD